MTQIDIHSSYLTLVKTSLIKIKSTSMLIEGIKDIPINVGNFTNATLQQNLHD
jgi:hypothetical protein